MGSCISKCMPNKHSRLGLGDDDDLVLAYDDEHVCGFVQDKLVISQAPPFIKSVPPTPLSNKISPFPPEPACSSSSSMSTSSFFTASGGSSAISSSTSSCSSSLSTASSAPTLSSKDRSFSNDFLLSCIKENPHVLRINSSIKASDYHQILSSPDKIRARGVGSPCRVPPMPSPARHSLPQRAPLALQGPTVQKRVRSSSPDLTRQKSMRVAEPDGLAYQHSLPGRVLRSPSPSRRFEGGDRKRETLAATTRLVAANHEEPTSIRPMSPLAVRKKEHMRPPSLKNNTNASRLRECAMGQESFAHQIGAKVEEIASKFSGPHDNVVDSADDVNNPLISLDCFIFL